MTQNEHKLLIYELRTKFYAYFHDPVRHVDSWLASPIFYHMENGQIASFAGNFNNVSQFFLMK